MDINIHPLLKLAPLLGSLIIVIIFLKNREFKSLIPVTFFILPLNWLFYFKVLNYPPILFNFGTLLIISMCMLFGLWAIWYGTRGIMKRETEHTIWVIVFPIVVKSTGFKAIFIGLLDILIGVMFLSLVPVIANFAFCDSKQWFCPTLDVISNYTFIIKNFFKDFLKLIGTSF